MTAVFLCNDDEVPRSAVELANASVTVLNDLCLNPRQIIPMISDDETSLVMGIHSGAVNLGAVQAIARRLGWDPLSLGVFDMAGAVDDEQVRLATAASVARSSHFPGSTPDQVKLLPSDRTTRRGLLSVGAPVYVGAPMVDPSSCVAGDGCRACAAACPADALSWTGGAIEYSINACIACGICVTACPIGAIRNPSADPTAIEAEIRTVITESSDPIGIRYRCRDSQVDCEPGWHLVEVPCTGMLTVGWLLAPRFLGAAASDAVSCSVGGCGLANDQRLEMTLRDSARASEALWSEHGGAPELSQTSAETVWLAHRSTGRVLEAAAPPASGLAISFEATDVGLVTIDPTMCTACEMCAQVCPTDALASSVNGSGVHITLDPRLCVACGQCVATCPEVDKGAISLSRQFDLSEWQLGRREVRHEPTPLCEICGQPVAPAAMLSRIEEMLGEDATATMAMISRRCVSCRGR